MRLYHFGVLLVVGILLVCSISVVQGDNIDVQTNGAFNNVDTRNLIGTDEKNAPDKTVDIDNQALSAEYEERAITPALARLRSGFTKARDLTRLKTAFKKRPPITTIRSADINQMKATLAKNPSLEKSLEKIPLKAAQTNARRMSGFEQYIMDMSLIKLLFVLTIMGVLATGAIIVTSIALPSAIGTGS